MTGDTQGHLRKRTKTGHYNTVSSKAATHTLNLEVTPAHEAADDNDNERIDELLQTLNVNVNELCFKKTPSIIARKESTDLLLIDLGVQLDFEEGGNALCVASYCGLKQVLQVAIGKGLDINEPFRGTHPILYAVKGGHADMVDHLLKRGVKISDFEVHPRQEGEFVTEDSKNPFSAAWYHQRYDIFLLLLDATLTHKCREERWEYSELLLQLDESDPRERLAERLSIWLKSRYWVPEHTDTEYAGPNMVIQRTLELVFGMGNFLRGDSILVRLLIEKKVPIPEFALAFLRRHWNGMSVSPDDMLKNLRLRPAILEITLTAWPLIWQKDKEDRWTF